MTTQNLEIMSALQAPFAEEHCGEVDSGNGFMASFSPAQVYENRLDEVLGSDWEVSYRLIESRGVECTLTLHFPDGTSRSRAGWGGFPGMKYKDKKTGIMEEDDENDFKAGESDAFKRACSRWGIGRFHYFVGVPNYVRSDYETPFFSRFLVSKVTKHNGHSAPQSNGGKREFGPPRTGKQFYPWMKEQEKSSGMSLQRQVEDFAKARGQKTYTGDWPDSFVPEGIAFVERVVSGATDQTPQNRPQATSAPVAGQNFYGHLEKLLAQWGDMDECNPDDRMLRRSELIHEAYSGLVAKKKLASIQGASEDEQYAAVEEVYAANKLALNAIFREYMKEQGVTV